MSSSMATSTTSHSVDVGQMAAGGQPEENQNSQGENRIQNGDANSNPADSRKNPEAIISQTQSQPQPQVQAPPSPKTVLSAFPKEKWHRPAARKVRHTHKEC